MKTILRMLIRRKQLRSTDLSVLYVNCVTVRMKSWRYTSLLILLIAHFVPIGTKHINVTLDAKWKSTPLLLEAW